MADPRDVASLDAILAAMHDSISGPPGGQDWERNASLYAPGARLSPIGAGPDGLPVARMMSHAEFVTEVRSLLADVPFYEVETSRTTERFSHLVHAFSSYESRREPEGEAFDSGVNSIQLLDDGTRWWVLNVTWARPVAG